MSTRTGPDVIWTKNVTTYVDPDTHRKILQSAQSNDMSMAQVMRRIILNWYRNHEASEDVPIAI